MKLHKQIHKIAIALIITLLTGVYTNSHAQAAQSPVARAQDTTTNSRLAKQIGISKDKAAQVRAAYNYKRDEIVKVMQDKTIKPQQKQQLLHQLMRERAARINASTLALTDQQKAALAQTQATGRQAMEAKRQQLRQEHEAQMQKNAGQPVQKGQTSH